MEEGNYASDKNDPVLYRKNNEKSRSFYTLGDFLCVERAAMSVELSKLQKEGLLITKRNHFQLLTR